MLVVDSRVHHGRVASAVVTATIAAVPAKGAYLNYDTSLEQERCTVVTLT